EMYHMCEWILDPWISLNCKLCNRPIKNQYQNENRLLYWDTETSFSSIKSWNKLDYVMTIICCNQKYDIPTRLSMKQLPPQIWISDEINTKQNIPLSLDPLIHPLFLPSCPEQQGSHYIYELRG